MDDLGDYLPRPLVKGLYLLVRLALWLVFELPVEVVAWWVGWCGVPAAAPADRANPVSNPRKHA